VKLIGLPGMLFCSFFESNKSLKKAEIISSVALQLTSINYCKVYSQQKVPKWTEYLIVRYQIFKIYLTTIHAHGPLFRD
jgi:hypothetical protein